MLGERSDQGGLWEADRLYLDHVGRDTFHGLMASPRGRLLRDADFAAFYVLLPRQRKGQRAAQPAGDGPPLPRGQALLLQSHDKVGDAGAKGRADFDIRWKSLPPATTGGGLGGGISRLMAIPGWIPGNPAGAGTPVRDRRQRILTPAWPRRPSPSWRLHGLGDDTRRLPGRGASRRTGSTVSHTKGAHVRVQSRPPAHTVDTTIFEMWLRDVARQPFDAPGPLNSCSVTPRGRRDGRWRPPADGIEIWPEDL